MVLFESTCKVSCSQFFTLSLSQRNASCPKKNSISRLASFIKHLYHQIFWANAPIFQCQLCSLRKCFFPKTLPCHFILISPPRPPPHTQNLTISYDRILVSMINKYELEPNTICPTRDHRLSIGCVRVPTRSNRRMFVQCFGLAFFLLRTSALY